MEFLVIWLLFCILPAAIASSKGRSGAGWFLLGILISPLLATIIVALMPNQKVAAQRHAELVAATSAVAAFAPTARIPPEGLPVWAKPDPALDPQAAPGGIMVAVLQRVDDWAQIKRSDGVIGWVDGRRLLPLAPPPPPPPA